MTSIPTPSYVMNAIFCAECVQHNTCAYVFESDYNGNCWKKKAIMHILKEVD